MLDGSAPALSERWARVEALLLDATARDRLGDRRAAEESLEAALDLAEPEGLDPALPALAEPRAARAPPEAPDRPRDAHLDDPRHAGRARRSSARAGGAATRRAERGGAARRQVPAEQPDRVGRSRRSSSCPPTPSGRTCATSTRSSTPTRAARPWLARASSGWSPLARCGADATRGRPAQLQLELDPVALRPQAPLQTQLLLERDRDPAARFDQIERAAGGQCVRDVDQPLSGLLRDSCSSC